ncbi:DUF3040 domain-containing protein [Streptomyces sp. NPDC049040]|uniref:DUF3040 domain-containing protein n=1 Tax=Streptomyces sp. NPDC049040 TaxID=3365593 RepID=UPI003721A15F
MVLSLHERRVIADMERSLSEEDPRLSKRLASFGRTYPEPMQPPPRAEGPPPEWSGGRRAGRFTVWSIALALTLLCAALALSAAGLLAAATVAALAGVGFWAVYRRQRRRQREGIPQGPIRGG